MIIHRCLLAFVLALSWNHAWALEPGTSAASAGRPSATLVAIRTNGESSLEMLTATPWIWETVKGVNVIEFAEDGTCYHTRFNGTFKLEDDGRVTINSPTRQQELKFDFAKGEFTGSDKVLKQTITGRRTTAALAGEDPFGGTENGPEKISPRKLYEAQVEKLARTPWTWETVMGKTTIQFKKDRTCVHTNFTGTFTTQPDDTVTVKLPTKDQVLVFDLTRGEYSGYDGVLKQKITGRRVEPK